MSIGLKESTMAEVRCPECNRTEQEGHAERCPHSHQAKDKSGTTVRCCPECGAPVGGVHAERCPFRLPPKAPDERNKLERTVEDWAANLADSIPKPQTIGWKTRLAVTTSGDNQKIIAPDGHAIGIKSQIATDKSGPEILWNLKLQKEPCKLCRFYSREQFEDKDRAELALFLQREAHWDKAAILLVLEDLTRFGLCQAHTEGADRLHVVHENASCLRLWQPKSKGWLSSFGGKLFGGSKKSGF